MKRDERSHKTGVMFQAICTYWREQSNNAALDWMATHIGHLVANVEKLQKQVKRLEKKARLK